MPKDIELTHRRHVEALPIPEEGQVLYWATAPRGFGVRVTPNGAKAYVVQARVNGNSRRKVIGPANSVNGAIPMPFDKALTLAMQRLVTLKHDKVDVSAQEREERAARKTKRVSDDVQGWTLQRVLNDYIDRRSLKPRTREEMQRHLRRNFDDWADAPVSGIDVVAVRKRFDMINARAPGQARQAMGLIRALLNFARKEASIRAGGKSFPLLPVNPVSLGLDEGALTPLDGRERMVPLNKVRAVWRMLTKHRAAALADSSERTGADMVAFGLLTGCRLGEAQNLTWGLLDLDGDVPSWQITAAVAKDGKARTLPLCAAAVELLRAREARPGNAFVFPSRTIKGRDHFKRPDKALGLVSKLAGLHLSFHDLRRTWQACADEAGVADWKSALLSSHKPQSVTGRHYRQKYDVRHLAADAEAVGSWITAT